MVKQVSQSVDRGPLPDHMAHEARDSRVASPLFCGLLAVLAALSPSLSPGRRRRCRPSSVSVSTGRPDDAGGGEAKVRFRAQGDSAWREGYPLWYAELDGEFRGSLVGLRSGTTYEIELTAPSGKKASLTAATRSEQFPIGKTTHLPGGEMDKPAEDHRVRHGRCLAPGDPDAGDQDRDRRVQPARQLRRGGGGLRHRPGTGAEERRTECGAHSQGRAERGRRGLPHDPLGPGRRRSGLGRLLWLRQRDLCRERRRRAGPPAQPDRESPRAARTTGSPAIRMDPRGSA